jgi:hypothetical protein
LTAKYSNDIALDYPWPRQNTNSLILYRRIQTRRIVETYLANMEACELDVPQPTGIFRAEFDYFKKELADKAFAAKRARFGAMATAMIEKRGYGNPMGRGGLARAQAFHVRTLPIVNATNFS